MRRSTMLIACVAGTVLVLPGLAGCSSILYLPSDAVNEKVDVSTDEELREEIVVYIESCDDLSINGTLSNNATSAASVDVTFQLDDGMSPTALSQTIDAPASGDQVFSVENTSGVNPILGCSATVDAVRIATD